MFLKKNKKQKNWQPSTRYRIKVKIRYKAKNKMKICPYAIKTVGLIFFLGFNMFYWIYKELPVLQEKKSEKRFGLGLRDLFVKCSGNVQLFATP